MDKELVQEQAMETIMQEFLSDNLLVQDEHGSYYGFDEILSKTIKQYTNDCFKGIISTIDLGNIRVYEYILKNKITYKSEITISQDDLNCCYKRFHRIA